MGYATFAFRKVSLSNQINDLQFKIMNLTMQQQDIAAAGSTVAGDNNASLFEFSSLTSGAKKILNGFATSASSQGGCNISGRDSQGMASYTFTENAAKNMRYKIYQDEKKIESQIKQLETQLNAKTKELESVEKGEENAIKRSTPKFA